MDNVNETTRVIRQKIGSLPDPDLAIILGSGLGGVADQIEVDEAIDYADLPHFGRSSAAGHRGQLIFGRLHDVQVVAMAGRFHFYEGWTLGQIAYPVQVMRALGAADLVVSNAAGGVRPGLNVGDLVLIRDVMNLMRGFGSMPIPETDLALSPAGVAGSPFRGSLFDASLRERMVAIARRHEVPVSEGTYLAMSGPTYETRAEYRMMRTLGVDVVGMSTVPEAIMGRRLGMRVLGISMVSNVANPDEPATTDHQEVIEAGAIGAERIQTLIAGWLGDRQSRSGGTR